MHAESFADYFSLFGLPERFAIDLQKLDTAYRDMQSKVHPDRFAHLSDAEQRVSMQWAAYANEAYQSLKNPLRRAAYLLQRAGRDVKAQSNTAMSPQFLQQQMLWREELEEAVAESNAKRLDSLYASLNAEIKVIQSSVEAQLDTQNDYCAATDNVRRWMFLEKVQQEIEEALEALEY